MNKMKYIITMFLLAGILGIIIFPAGCENKPASPTLDYSREGEVVTEFNREQFNNLTEEQKIETVNKGYFYTCEEIRGYCTEHPDLEGCKKYCHSK